MDSRVGPSPSARGELTLADGRKYALRFGTLYPALTVAAFASG
jgi:hypothetical protein